MTDQALLEQAKKAREMAYAPYSKFMVGAALFTKDQRVVLGCNIENAAHSPGCCAERTAFYKAVSNGHLCFEKIAIAGALRGKEPDTLCPPCGVCRQVMQEFCDPKTFRIIMAEGRDGVKSMTLEELLPLGFGPKDLAMV